MKFKISSLLAILCLTSATVFMSGCAYSTTTSAVPLNKETARGAPSIAVAPFENLSTYKNAGLAVTDLANTLLYAQKHFRVVEVSSLQKTDTTEFRNLETVPWEKQLGANTAIGIELGKRLETDYILAGSIGEYGFIDGFGENANVAINLRLVEVDSGAVKWTGSMSRRVCTPAFNEESVHKLAHNVLIDLLDRMDAEICGKHRLKSAPFKHHPGRWIY
ncbi:MAG: CsgG/HfaB family protein [Verrucomicrobia bacterium]|nr:CsgG/HfaB family protein [Verrucomicrobiota bacterium]